MATGSSKVVALGPTTSVQLLRYYLGPDHPFKIRVWNWFFDRLRWPLFTIPYFGGWIALDLRDYLQRMVLLHGEYEGEVAAALRRFSSQDEILWDIGAHVGTFSVKAASWPGIREVHAFEPVPKTFAHLNYNLGLNKLPVFAHPWALGETDTEREIHLGSWANSGLAGFIARPPTQDTGTVRVREFRIDSLLEHTTLPAPTLLKVDVEEWEMHVFRGAEQLLKRRPPKAIAFECLRRDDDDAGQLELERYLTSFGYRIQPLRALRDAGEDSGKMRPDNFIAFR